ncbi:MAG TPA: DNA polymerase III subunit epsilon [Gammaproteobacteria bacterium]|nr:DNA polymerase III subunit epsilon [Gammaproteobacteria bacterium]
MRQVVLDTETTGLEPSQGHRIIEIGCVELINRRVTDNRYHQYINPEREVDEGAVQVHGLTNEFLADKPLFADIAEDFLRFIKGAELIIHNAPFDVGFIEHEFRLLRGKGWSLDGHCNVLDTLAMARRMHPGQKNNLDALCRRYEVDNAHRELHGALLDAEILADVYLLMTGGQARLSLEGEGSGDAGMPRVSEIRRLPAERSPLPVIAPSEAELAAHAEMLARVAKAHGGPGVWQRLDEAPAESGPEAEVETAAP